ncbi:MAG: hypothetical protein ACREFE_04990 [Limisphaerales bacterium]
MALVDFILNFAGLLLWINWRSMKFDPLNKRAPATLVGTLRRAAPSRFRQWYLPAAIGALLFLRALFYWQIGSAGGWIGKLDLGIAMFFFRSIFFGKIFLFSILSFGQTLGIFYLCLLLLSILSGPEPVHQLARIQLGDIDRWPRWLKFILPLTATALLWWLTSWLLEWLQIIPKSISAAQRIEESLVIGLSSYLVWKFVIGALLVLHLLNSYIYFGKSPVWNYINAASQTLLWPLRKIPLIVGKVDFSPAVEIAIVFFVAELAERGLVFLYGRLPF